MIYTYPFKDVEKSTKLAVWNKGAPIVVSGRTYDRNMWRRDICGNIIKYTDHGDTTSKHGWEIDHIFPTSKGGKTIIDNLQPLYWKNNREKGDTYPWFC